MPIKRHLPVQELPHDEAVSAALGEQDPVYGRMSDRRSRARNLTPGQRRRRERDRARVKFTYDLPARLGEQVEALAREYRSPQSQVVAILLLEALTALEQGAWSFADYEREPSHSPRYDWNFVLPEIEEKPG